MFKSNENTIILISILSALFRSDTFDSSCEEKMIKDIIDYLKRDIANNYYKVSTEGFKASGIQFHFLSQDEMENKNLIMSLYNDILPKFKTQDIDQEIKIATSKAIDDIIECCGKLLNENEIKELFKISLIKQIMI